jgi:hypothetical protein
MIALAAVLASVTPLRVTVAPHLDGRLDDAAWARATPFTAFVQKDPDAGAKPSEPIALRVVYDETSLWIGVDCTQRISPRVARLTRRDREVDSDHVEIDLDTRATGRDAFHFEVNAAGVLLDALRYDDTDITYDWDENWEARAAVTPTGWSAEIRIPFRVLRYSRVPGERWGFQVRRFISARQEIDELSPIPRGEAGETSRYGELGPFDALPDQPSVELRPYVLASLAHAADGTFTPRATAGGDLKWHVTPTLTLDATINPDFAQVEADQRVLNLSTYETYYPEKRPFFLEGSDLFAAPIQVLYTRRIGRVPDPPVLPAGEVEPATPDPAPLYAATKLVGTAGGDTQVGALAAVTGPERVETHDLIGTHARDVDPESLYAALRVRRGLGERGYIGLFATAVSRFETGRESYPSDGAQSLCPDGSTVAIGQRCTHDAYVTGLDSRWRSTSGAYEVDGDVAASLILGGPPRMQRDGVVIASGDASPQARIHAAKEDNGPVYDISVDAAGRRFDINDAGFLDRANYIHTDWNVGWKDTTPGAFVRQSTTFAEIFYWRNWLGERIDGGYQVNTQLTFLNYWQMFTELHWRPWHFDDREVGNGVALQRSGRLGWELSLTTDPRKRVLGSWSQSAYFVANGITYTGDGDVTIHAIAPLDVELLPSVLVARGEPRYVLADPITGDNVFGRQDARAFGITLRTTYTFTPRATLQIYGQLFGESVAYRDYGRVPASDREVLIADLVPTTVPASEQPNTSSTILDASAVFRWEYRLGSTLYAVYTRSQGVDRAYASLQDAPIPWASGLRVASNQVFLIKASYWW